MGLTAPWTSRVPYQSRLAWKLQSANLGPKWDLGLGTRLIEVAWPGTLRGVNLGPGWDLGLDTCLGAPLITLGYTMD